MPDPVAGLDSGKEIARVMRPHHTLLVKDSWDQAVEELDLDLAFDLDMPEVQRVLDKLGKQVKGVADTTIDDIQRLVGQAADEGWSPQELAAAISDLGEIASKSRAVTIARTEGARAYSQGSMLAWQESGVVDRKEWLTDPKGACPLCEELSGMIVDLDAEFADGIDAPPYHPGCECATRAILSED